MRSGSESTSGLPRHVFGSARSLRPRRMSKWNARYDPEEHRLLCVSAVRLGFLRFVVRLRQLVDERLRHIRRDASVPLDQWARVEHRFSRV